MKRTLIPVLLDPDLVARFESPEAINAALRILVDAAQLLKQPKTRARRASPMTDSDVNVPDADYAAALNVLANAPAPPRQILPSCP
jgi:hypothetical protein